MNWKVKVWVPITTEEENIYIEEEKAYMEMKNAMFMQPENKYKVMECDEDGNEI